MSFRSIASRLSRLCTVSHSLHTSPTCCATQKYITPMRDRRDLPDPENTNIYAGAVYVEEWFDELVMNLNDQSYVHEGDRLHDDMMIRRFMDNVFANRRTLHTPMRWKLKEVVIKRRLNHMDIYIYFDSDNTIRYGNHQIVFLSSFAERIISEMFAVMVQIHPMKFNVTNDYFKNRNRPLELGPEWTPNSV